MANKGAKIAIITIVLLVGALLLSGKINTLFAVVPGQVSDGFFLYGDSSTALTNLSTQTISSGGSCPFTISSGTSSYWDTQGINGNVVGGDTELKLTHSVGTSCANGWAAATSAKGFSGRDFKADINVDVISGGCAASGTLTVQLVDNKIPQNPCSNGICPFPSDGVTLLEETKAAYCDNIRYNAFSGSFELHRNIFSNSTDVLWKGQKVSTINTTGQERVRFIATAGLGNPYQGGSTIEATITNPRSRPIFSCELRPGDILAMESFSGGQSSNINISSLRFPVKSFCLAHPAILTDSTRNGSTSTAEPYNLLINGQNVPITQTQTLTLFYVFDNTAGLVPTQCSQTQGYNTGNSSCVDLTGIVQVCSQGILDPGTGTCVVQPSITCSNGTYNSGTNRCEYTPSSAYVCAAGFTYNNQTNICEKNATAVTACTNGRYDLQTQTCVFNPPVSKICSQGTYNNQTDQCELKIDVNCPAGLTYDSASQSCKGQPSSTTAVTNVSTTTAPQLASTAYVAAASSAFVWLTPFTGFLILAIILGVLYLLFFSGSNGRRRWDKFKEWLRRNKEGIIVGAFLANLLLFIQFYPLYFIPIIGTALNLIRGSYPLFVVAFLVNVLFMGAGALADAIYKPRK